ncbi:MAG: hypothetical protein A3J09_02340 [Candidatus Zambryskibacteria bacterium RIFCSPLOWO2_02_FULL_51_21]|uniref:Uncharacterized protein n=1 Tax=Candidatus Zambryskibacteria bacterium RIFCSPHIGHO2_02_FULL_43_37 TaxID=1802749 RepID=A0A1G2TGR0_9BACT|nr:MAG: hypothetical protein A2723_02340 [Candidatus Zambryskibacteria bacterium RIFCSPHIGHO2_01_FULL_52_18]OHA96372.1 MAG: hypothetical protein A3D49_00560 [Candidatus Zambryskibacteria bacterium RIFCSPHIGHO2_02_FULL_43_37]OHB07772.1 MAG: hypothetical protein A2944_00425 [Candidatus Zambryskibacteria bacterium RIFCSPLOWO2_01_FULL_52_12]OHB11368.1 MAG: hypothetical protein A3J09_02340 [Candidatus Zambryskibacteria bacterium RIFCSPLOWO2_02_FULL_51_21]
MYHYCHPEEVERIISKLARHELTAKSLQIIKSHHEETYKHSLRVAKLSIDLALENNLSEKTVRMIGCAALLHDFGKTKIDARILSKKSSLTRLETLVVMKHPHMGAQELKNFLPKKARRIIENHHHPTDRLTQIVSAADMYDALTFPRTYKDGLPIEKVLEIMSGQFAGKARLIDQLKKRLVQHPRSQYRLN